MASLVTNGMNATYWAKVDMLNQYVYNKDTNVIPYMPDKDFLFTDFYPQFPIGTILRVYADSPDTFFNVTVADQYGTVYFSRKYKIGLTKIKVTDESDNDVKNHDVIAINTYLYYEITSEDEMTRLIELAKIKNDFVFDEVRDEQLYNNFGSLLTARKPDDFTYPEYRNVLSSYKDAFLVGGTEAALNLICHDVTGEDPTITYNFHGWKVRNAPKHSLVPASSFGVVLTQATPYFAYNYGALYSFTANTFVLEPGSSAGYMDATPTPKAGDGWMEIMAQQIPLPNPTYPTPNTPGYPFNFPIFPEPHHALAAPDGLVASLTDYVNGNFVRVDLLGMGGSIMMFGGGPIAAVPIPWMFNTGQQKLRIEFDALGTNAMLIVNGMIMATVSSVPGASISRSLAFTTMALSSVGINVNYIKTGGVSIVDNDTTKDHYYTHLIPEDETKIRVNPPTKVYSINQQMYSLRLQVNNSTREIIDESVIKSDDGGVDLLKNRNIASFYTKNELFVGVTTSPVTTVLGYDVAKFEVVPTTVDNIVVLYTNPSTDAIVQLYEGPSDDFTVDRTLGEITWINPPVPNANYTITYTYGSLTHIGPYDEGVHYTLDREGGSILWGSGSQPTKGSTYTVDYDYIVKDIIETACEKAKPSHIRLYYSYIP